MPVKARSRFCRTFARRPICSTARPPARHLSASCASHKAALPPGPQEAPGRSGEGGRGTAFAAPRGKAGSRVPGRLTDRHTIAGRHTDAGRPRVHVQHRLPGGWAPSRSGPRRAPARPGRIGFDHGYGLHIRPEELAGRLRLRPRRHAGHRPRAGQRRRRADRPRRRTDQGAGPPGGGGQEARRPGEVEAGRASVRVLRPAEGHRADGRAPEAGGQFPLALPRPVLRGSRAGQLHVPHARAQRHPETLAVRRHCRPGGPRRRGLLARHDPVQSAGARDPARARISLPRRLGRRRHHPARRGFRQHPQRHGIGHGRHRPRRASRHAPPTPRTGTTTSSTPA